MAPRLAYFPPQTHGPMAHGHYVDVPSQDSPALACQCSSQDASPAGRALGALLDSVLAGRAGGDVLLTAGRVAVCVDDARRLRCGGWFTDALINGYLALRYANDAAVAVLDTAFMHLFRRHGLNSALCFGRDIAWGRTRVVLVPVNVNGNHWRLLVVDVEQKRIEIWDPLGWGSTDADGDDLVLLRQWLALRLAPHDAGGPCAWPAIDRAREGGGIKLQTGGDDCGVFVCAYADAVACGATDLPGAWTADDMRGHIARLLLVHGTAPPPADDDDDDDDDVVPVDGPAL